MRFAFLLFGLCASIMAAMGQQNGSEVPFRKKIDIGPLSGQARKATDDAPAIKVLLATPDSISLGYILPGRGNETTHLVGDSGVTRWFHTGLERRYGKGVAGTQHAYTWVIKNISIASDTSGTFAFAHVSADIFREIDKEKLQSLLSVDTVLIFPEGDSASYSPALDNSLDVLSALTLDTTRADVSKADPQTLGNGVPQTVYYREDSPSCDRQNPIIPSPFFRTRCTKKASICPCRSSNKTIHPLWSRYGQSRIPYRTTAAPGCMSLPRTAPRAWYRVHGGSVSGAMKSTSSRTAS